MAQAPAAMTFRAGDVLEFSITPNERLNIGSFKVTYDYANGKESIFLITTANADIEEASLEYSGGQLTEGAIRMGGEPGLIIDVRTQPPTARWEAPEERALPDPAEVVRRTQILESTGSAVRVAFGLGQFHGGEEEEVGLVLDAREIVTVNFSTPEFWRAAYLFIDPATENMVEVLRYEDFAERRMISVATRRVVIERYMERGLLNGRTILVWEDGRWRAEEDEYRVDRTVARSRVISAAEARAILSEAAATVARTRRQFQTENFTVSLERFGSP